MLARFDWTITIKRYISLIAWIYILKGTNVVKHIFSLSHHLQFYFQQSVPLMLKMMFLKTNQLFISSISINYINTTLILLLIVPAQEIYCESSMCYSLPLYFSHLYFQLLPFILKCYIYSCTIHGIDYFNWQLLYSRSQAQWHNTIDMNIIVSQCLTLWFLQMRITF